MNPTLKKVLLITGFFAVVVALAFGIYWLFFRKPAVEVPAPGAPGVTGQLPITEQPPTVPGEVQPPTPGLPTVPGVPREFALPEGVPTQERSAFLTAGALSNISMSPAGVRSYNPADGRFYRVAPDGTVTALSDQAFYNVDSVDWANTTDRAIINYPDGSNIFYDFSSGRQVTLPQHWEDFSFAPNDNQIAAKSIGNNESNRFLIVANPDGTNAHPVEQLGNNQDKVHVDWTPNNQVIAYSFTGEPLGYDRQSVILVGQNQENFKALVVEGRGFIPKWSPDGSQVLYSVYNSSDQYLPSLWISGAVGDQVNANRRNLHINTWADKCAWQSQTIVICGVPTELGTGAGLQRAAFAGIPDNIVRINLQTGTVTNLGQPATPATVKTMTVTEDGSAAIFTDETTGRLIRFNL